MQTAVVAGLQVAPPQLEEALPAGQDLQQTVGTDQELGQEVHVARMLSSQGRGHHNIW